MSYEIHVKASAASQFDYQTITLPRGLMGYAPKSLIDRIKKGEISEQEVKDNTEKLVTMIFSKNTISPKRGFTHKELKLLSDLLRPPIKINPCVYADSWRRSSLAGHTLLGALLSEENFPPWMIKKLIEGGVDCSKFPNEPFILAAARFQPVEAFDLLKEAGANIQIKDEDRYNAIYHLFDDTLWKRKENFEKLDWLLDHGVDGYGVCDKNLTVNYSELLSPFKHHHEKKFGHPAVTIGMLERGMGRIEKIPMDAIDVARLSLKGDDAFNVYYLYGERSFVVENHRKDDLLKYCAEAETMVDAFVSGSRMPEELTAKEMLIAYSTCQHGLFSKDFWQGHESHLMELYSQLPKPIQAEFIKGGVGALMTTHIARTQIHGPAQSWGVIAAATTERGKGGTS